MYIKRATKWNIPLGNSAGKNRSICKYASNKITNESQLHIKFFTTVYIQIMWNGSTNKTYCKRNCTAGMPIQDNILTATFAYDIAMICINRLSIKSSKYVQQNLNNLKTVVNQSKPMLSIKQHTSPSWVNCPPVSFQGAMILEKLYIKYLYLHLDCRLTWVKPINIYVIESKTRT